MMNDLFGDTSPDEPAFDEFAAGAVLLRGRALPPESDLLQAIDAVLAAAPFRHMVTPGGFPMSVAMTNCGEIGWVTDRSGYRYDAIDPQTELRRKLATACRILAHAGLVEDVLGHVSARVGDDHVLVRCRGSHERGLAFTTPDDIRLLSFDGGDPGEGYSAPNLSLIHI